MHVFGIAAVKDRLVAAGGGYETVINRGPRARRLRARRAAADRQQPYEDDEVYVVLEGNGMLEVEDESLRSRTAMPCSSRPAPSTASAPTSS